MVAMEHGLWGWIMNKKKIFKVWNSIKGLLGEGWELLPLERFGGDWEIFFQKEEPFEPDGGGGAWVEVVIIPGSTIQVHIESFHPEMSGIILESGGVELLLGSDLIPATLKEWIITDGTLLVSGK